MNRVVTLLLLCLLALALAACGEKEETETTQADAAATTSAAGGSDGNERGGDDKPGDDPEKLSAEDQVEITVETVIGGADPAAACSAQVTERYVRAAYGDERGCRAAVSAQKPFDVEVSAIEIEDPGAAADARPEGGPNRGEKLKVRLIKEGKSWLVDSALSTAPAGP